MNDIYLFLFLLIYLCYTKISFVNIKVIFLYAFRKKKTENIDDFNTEILENFQFKN